MGAVALAPREQLDLSFEVRSVPKLREDLMAQRIERVISKVHLSRILRREGLSLQRTKTWKQANDPHYSRKKAGGSGRQAPFKEHRRVIAYDEFGPFDIRPHHGTTWTRQQHAPRLPAIYVRPYGTCYLLSAFDLLADELWDWQRPNQHRQELLAFLKGIRRRYPMTIRLFILMDNRRCHKKQEVLDGCAIITEVAVHAHCCSWLNPLNVSSPPLKGSP